MTNIWDELQIEQTSDKQLIRRAYARRLKEVHPEDNPDAFQTLRAAYEMALTMAEFIPWGECNEKEQAAEDAGEEIPQPKTSFEYSDQQWHDLTIQIPPRRLSERTPNPAPADVQDLVGNLLEHLAKRGEDAAVLHFRETLKSPAMENIEQRECFEELLVRELCSLETPPFHLMETVVEVLNLEAKATLVTAELTDEYAHLLGRVLAGRAYARLLKTAQQTPTPNQPYDSALRFDRQVITKQEVFVAGVLTGPYDPKRFLWMALKPGNVKLVTDSLARLELRTPETLLYEINHDTTQWWRRALELQQNFSRQLKQSVGKIILAFFISGMLDLLLEQVLPSSLRPAAFILAWTIGLALVFGWPYIRSRWVGRASIVLWNGLFSWIGRMDERVINYLPLLFTILLVLQFVMEIGWLWVLGLAGFVFLLQFLASRSPRS